MRFKQRVLETRVYVVDYTVEAEDAAEAANKAAIGDTVDETEVKCDGVIQRDALDLVEQMEQGIS